MANPLLSILIPTVPGRVSTFFLDLLDCVRPQTIDGPHLDVEILGFYDNKHRTVGEKRNDLLNLAHGRYVAFIDDDDTVADDYLDTIMPILRSGKDIDVLVFDQHVTVNGGPPKLCRYGVELPYTETDSLWTGLPAHTMVWKALIAKTTPFPACNFQEDMAWVRLAAAKVNPLQQHRVEKVLYYYNFNAATSETRG
jgi:glycosyltransferase involved in cell wall biosynthesis